MLSDVYGNSLLCVTEVTVMCSSEICCAECCIGNSLLCVTVVTVVCSSEIYSTEC